MTAAWLALLLAAPVSAQEYRLPEPPPGPRVDYSADRVEFDSERSLLHLSGHVVLHESTWTVKGEELWLDTERQAGRSDGPLLVEDGVSAVYGESGEFDFANSRGHLKKTKGGMGDWSIEGREAVMAEDRRLFYSGARFTSCTKHPPHYHFRASRVRVNPKKSMFARNVVFYLGPVPVFYTPIFFRSLHAYDTWGWKSQPGYDSRNGPFVKNSLLTQHGSWTYSKLYVDYYVKQGFGTGAELERRKGEDSRGAIFGYRIKEISTGDERWTFLAQGYQALASSTAFQSRLQLQSDADFNNHYVRSSFFRVTPELINDAAVVHRFAHGNARLSYSRLDSAAENRREFKLRREVAPRLEYQSGQMRLWRLPWLNTFTGAAQNELDSTRPFLQKTVLAGWEGTNSLNLAKGVSWTPKLSANETFYNRFDTVDVAGSTGTVLDAFVMRWTGANTVRFKSRVGDWDATHAYTRRLKADSFAADRPADDKGVEQNLFTLSNLFIPHRKVWARLSSGYDFRTFRTRAVSQKERVQPIVLQANWQATNRLAFTLREDYSPFLGQRGAIADARYGDEEGAFVGGGFSYNRADPGRYYGNLEFAIAPSSPTWRVSVALRARAESPGGISRLRGGQLYDKEFAWTKRWHDFYTRVAGRYRAGGVGEASVRVDFKFGKTDPRQAPRRDWEAEWFPERAKNDEYRP